MLIGGVSLGSLCPLFLPTISLTISGLLLAAACISTVQPLLSCARNSSQAQKAVNSWQETEAVKKARKQERGAACGVSLKSQGVTRGQASYGCAQHGHTERSGTLPQTGLPFMCAPQPQSEGAVAPLGEGAGLRLMGKVPENQIRFLRPGKAER